MKPERRQNDGDFIPDGHRHLLDTDGRDEEDFTLGLDTAGGQTYNYTGYIITDTKSSKSLTEALDSCSIKCFISKN